MIYLPFPFKRCIKCGEYYLPNTRFFYARKDSIQDKLKNECRYCVQKRSHIWMENNREAAKERSKRWGKLHPDKVKQRSQKWIRDNPERASKNRKTWRKNNKDKWLEYSRHRKQNKRSAISGFSTIDWKQALSYWHGTCAYCGNPPSLWDKPRVLHQDHFVPLSAGGNYTLDNIIPACQSCNLSKNKSEPHKWLISRFGKHKAKRIEKRIATYFKWVRERNS